MDFLKLFRTLSLSAVFFLVVFFSCQDSKRNEEKDPVLDLKKVVNFDNIGEYHNILLKLYHESDDYKNKSTKHTLQEIQNILVPLIEKEKVIALNALDVKNLNSAFFNNNSKVLRKDDTGLNVYGFVDNQLKNIVLEKKNF